MGQSEEYEAVGASKGKAKGKQTFKSFNVQWANFSMINDHSHCVS